MLFAASSSDLSQVTPFLKKLHWLPIQHRILFKYNLLVFKAINLSQPPYLSALITLSSLTHGNRLSVSSTCPKKHIGRRGFAVPCSITRRMEQAATNCQISANNRWVQKPAKDSLVQAGIPPTLVIPWRALFRCQPMSVPGLFLLGLKHIR